MHPNRIGKFRITDHTLEHMFEGDAAILLPLLMAQVVIVKAEYDYASCTIEYVAYSQAFDEIPLGQVPPTYQWIITKTERPGEDVGLYDFTVKPERVAAELVTYTTEDIRL